MLFLFAQMTIFMEDNWIWRIKNEEDQALKDIYSMFRGDCLQWLQSGYNLDNDDSHEVFQASVIILYDNVITNKLTTLTSGIKTYLMAIAKYQALNLNKIKYKIANHEINNSIEYYVLTDEDEETEKNHLLQKAVAAVEILGDPCKSLLQLFYYKQMNMEDITVLMGYKNTDTTKNQKYKCIKRLQKIYFSY